MPDEEVTVSRAIRLLLVLLLTLAGAAVAVPAASAAPAACAVSWGSLTRTAPVYGTAPLDGVRTGRHACYDRVVFDVAGPVGGFSVGYVDRVVADGSGAVVPVPGGARLQVHLHHPAYDVAGRPTLAARTGGSLADVRGYSTLRSVVFAGSFEGRTTVGVGTRARLPFRVTMLPGPDGRSRIVVDVAHRWS